MKEKLLELLNDIDEDIVLYKGENLFDDGIIDSFSVVEIVSAMESSFKIEINANDVVEKNFRTVESMMSLLERLVD